MGNLKVITSNFPVTIQDQGRRQCQHLGLAEAGALDKHAYLWSNYLLLNSPHAASLEILVGDCTFSFDAPTTIAITGAEMGATINNKPVDSWSTIAIHAGDILQLGFIESGLRSYLSIAGGFEVPLFFSSCSTMIREKTGGIHGDKLTSGDLVGYTETNSIHSSIPSCSTPKKYIPDYNSELTLRFFPSYHFNEFDQSSIEQCLSSSYTVTNDADRMGYRLTGPPLTRDKGNILSIGVPCGAIQVPTAGEPIILLNDRQCTGGYPILGVIALRDIYQLAQRKAGDIVRFRVANVEGLRKEAVKFYKFFNNKIILTNTGNIS
jgi:biotin-dependent carboxylase-like uncharacterized protein